MSAIAVEFRYSSAFLAIYLGSLVKNSPVSGSLISPIMLIVDSENGSTNEVPESGIRSISLSKISLNPFIELPSNPNPAFMDSSVSCSAGTVKCCHIPGISVNFKSTNLTFLMSLLILSL